MSRPQSQKRFATAEVPPELLERFRAIAKAEHRSVSAEIRRLMEMRVAEYEQEQQAA